MKKYISVLLALIVFVSTVSAAVSIPASDVAKDKSNAPDNSPVMDEDWNLENPRITIDWTTGEARADFIHYKEKAVNKQAKGSACYKTFAKWTTTPVTYYINPTNLQGLSDVFVTSAISLSAEAWDDETSRELFDPYISDNTAQYSTTRDYKNSIDFGPLSEDSAIAVTSIWYNFFTKQIYETDMRFNTRYTWGDATVSGSSVVDLQNIGTHEFGHVGGLDDIYKPVCGQVTMYGYSGYGDTSKRSLEVPDITGLRSLYGS